MHDPATAASVVTSSAFARLARAVDTLSSAIAGFALLAGARAFTFIALMALREPVAGGAALVLLALVGWLRWQWQRQRRTRRPLPPQSQPMQCDAPGIPHPYSTRPDLCASRLLQSVSMRYND
jgi:hypothetical protein